MRNVTQFALDLLESLSHIFDDAARWEHAVARLNEFGFKALNMGQFTPKSGILHWARSSMAPNWLKLYAEGGYSDADLVLAQARQGPESLYIDSGRRLQESNSDTALALYSGLVEHGYRHVFSLIVPCPGNQAMLVALFTDHPEADSWMTEQSAGMRILATVIGTNLGPGTEHGQSSGQDLTPILGTTAPLSRREREALHLLADGLRNEQIAAAMKISEVTVRMHLKSARDKLRAPTREAALVRAMQMGLLSDPAYRNR
ncbi:helix-turn-helix transcriptional regulator [Ruegeria pomeroyi]|uniref:Transcriptional regulator, LuxR family n=2 Tax=Ruegeria pomeroyi TaxID=89184 RepID=Q5LSK3_RUEPO|nr:helix-turn-helix transcriptional regulator [Ruegeria pomeroyi]AAV95044.1 transcriptional regulator, LuxR family [Ruegeria pomeroyi DSS-3]NVK98090.1 helix-turn-helix transcriptional regulator [Ruegeria pomeroyi]NVL01810.1 helix-turn-helix transcriptional regulator [Ruegeria pomeroyi]QWV08621.1 helix-turn-helix transcriptional regulator [Ruegeria pomeroyi]